MLWFWGLGGAFIYAGSLLSAQLAEHAGEDKKPPRWPFVFKFLVALLIGAIAAEAFTGMLVSYFKLTVEPPAMRGLAALVGYGANKFDLQRLVERFLPGAK